jgi:hypothetical protein
MRVTIFMATVIFMLAASLYAHEGRISLFTDSLATDCNADLLPINLKTIYLVYIRGDGPDALIAYEFSLQATTENVLIGNPTWPPDATAIGNVADGVSVSASYPLPADDIAWLGTIQILNTGEENTFLVSIREHPTAEPPGINIVEYPSHEKKQVLGGAFVFNGDCEFDNV